METTKVTKKRHATYPAEQLNTDEAELIRQATSGNNQSTGSNQPIGQGANPKGEGKGKNKGKDTQQQPRVSTDLRPIVELQRRACIRLLQQQRETAPETQLIIEMPDTATEVRQHLASTYQTMENNETYKRQTSQGRTSLGSLAHFHQHMSDTHQNNT